MWLTRICVIEDLKYVFSLRKTEKERSAEHELAGEIMTILSNFSTSGNIYLTSGVISQNSLTLRNGLWLVL